MAVGLVQVQLHAWFKPFAWWGVMTLDGDKAKGVLLLWLLHMET
jgi:hypothetical protein